MGAISRTTPFGARQRRIHKKAVSKTKCWYDVCSCSEARTPSKIQRPCRPYPARATLAVTPASSPQSFLGRRWSHYSQWKRRPKWPSLFPRPLATSRRCVAGIVKSEERSVSWRARTTLPFWPQRGVEIATPGSLFSYSWSRRRLALGFCSTSSLGAPSGSCSRVDVSLTRSSRASLRE